MNCRPKRDGNFVERFIITCDMVESDVEAIELIQKFEISVAMQFLTKTKSSL